MLQKRDNKIEKAFGAAPEGAKETEAKKSYRELGRERAERVKEKTKAALERSRGLGERAVGGLKRIGKTGVEYAFAVPELLKDAGKAGIEGIKGLGGRAKDWAEKKYIGMRGWLLENAATLYFSNETMVNVFRDKIKEAVEISKDYVDQRREARRTGKLSEQRQKLEIWTGKQTLTPERQNAVKSKILYLNNVDKASNQLKTAAA